MITGRDIMIAAGRILNDEGYVRWTLPELCAWCNEAVRAILLAKPSASSATVALELQLGTLQHIDPAAGALSLLSIIRNLDSVNEPRNGGRIIRLTARNLLDAQEPNWHDPAYVKYGRQVRQYVYDEMAPLEFYVYPGNDGTGIVEAAICSLPPPLVADPATDPGAVDAYAGDLGLPEPYSSPLLDYVLYRAESKDDTGASGGRAMAHYQQFAAAVGLKIKVEGANSPNSRRATQ